MEDLVVRVPGERRRRSRSSSRARPSDRTESVLSEIETMADSDHDHHERTNNNHTTTNNKKQVFFGVPVVGFFRPADPKNPPIPPTKPKGVTFQEIENVSSDDSEDDDKELASFSASASLNRTPPHGYGATDTTTGKRTGQELWAILRQHVHNHDFHIHDKVRQNALFQSTRRGGTAEQDSVHFRDIDLPYDFSLLDCLLALMAYLAISVIAYSFVFEKWSMIDSMYFAVVTFTTIGYGDYSPSTTGGRLFCVLFALGGVAVLAIALGVVGHKIVESQVSTISAAETKLVEDLAAAFRKRITASERRGAYAKSRSGSNGGSSTSSFSYLADCDQLGHSVRRRAKDIQSPWHKTIELCQKFGSMLATYIPSLAPLFMGAFLIGHFEGWTWTDVIYYCVVTTTSIGYGDLTPAREDMRLFAVLYIPLAVGAMGHFLGTVATFIVEERTKKTNEVLWKHELTLDDLRSMSSSDGTVTELDFLVFMLKAMKKVDDDLIMAIREHFRSLDLTNSGTLVRKDLELQAKRKLRAVKAKLRLSSYKNELLRKSSVGMSAMDEEMQSLRDELKDLYV